MQYTPPPSSSLQYATNPTSHCHSYRNPAVQTRSTAARLSRGAPRPATKNNHSIKSTPVRARCNDQLPQLCQVGCCVRRATKAAQAVRAPLHVHVGLSAAARLKRLGQLVAHIRDDCAVASLQQHGGGEGGQGEHRGNGKQEQVSDTACQKTTMCQPPAFAPRTSIAPPLYYNKTHRPRLEVHTPADWEHTQWGRRARCLEVSEGC